MDIDTADHVLHGPSGESWVVAYVRGGRLAWCGWPQGEAALADCTLLKKATAEDRIKLLREMAASNSSDARCAYARGRLEADGDNEPDPDPGEYPSGDMHAARRRRRTAMLTDSELQTLRNLGNESEAAADEIVRLRAELAAHQPLHASVCQAVALLNVSPDIARLSEGREVHDLLRQALATFADAYMDLPPQPHEREVIARKHRRAARQGKEG